MSAYMKPEDSPKDAARLLLRHRRDKPDEGFGAQSFLMEALQSLGLTDEKHAITPLGEALLKALDEGKPLAAPVPDGSKIGLTRAGAESCLEQVEMAVSWLDGFIEGLPLLEERKEACRDKQLRGLEEVAETLCMALYWPREEPGGAA